MRNEIVINAEVGETRVALIESGQFAELHIERQRDRSVVGNVVKGRVSRVLPGMQAAFVDIGLEKAAFLSDRNGADDVYFNYSRNGGVTWQSTDTRLDTGDGPGVSDSDKYRICCSGSRIFVVWEDLRNGLEDIYLNYSTNSGVTWLGTDIRIDGGDVPGAMNSDDPHICCGGEYVYAVWDDDRNLQRDIFFNGSTP